MKRVTAMMSAAAIVLMAVGVLAQAKPNFAGKWVMDPASAPAAPAGGGGRGGGGRGGGGGLGMELTITQDATTIKLDYVAGGRNPAPTSLTYKLDGSVSTNSIMGRGGEATPTPAKASWDGATLVVVTTTAAGDSKRVFAMDGANLKITTTQPGFGGGEATTTSLIYKKG